jgi:glycosyltransferase involved in cell wall biosynthesis
MKILLLSASPVIPANNGAKIRIFATNTILTRRHEITMVSVQEGGAARPAVESTPPWKDYQVGYSISHRWQTILKSCFSRYCYGQVKVLDSTYQAFVEELLKKEDFDVIWLATFNMTPYFERCIQGKYTRPLVLLDLHNVDEMYYGSFIRSDVSWLVRLYAAFEVMKSKRMQRIWFPRFDAILCVSDEDLKVTQSYLNGHTQAWLVPNGVDVDYFTPAPYPLVSPNPAPVLVFGGSMDVVMNQDAVRWFVSTILPILQKQIPEIQFWAVGRNPPASLVELDGKNGVRVTGTVPDVREYYRQADVFIIPSRFGSGTKLKAMEAMSMGLPVVSTSIGVQGIHVESGRHLCIADEPAEFAANVIELLHDRPRAARMGVEGRQQVVAHYSWEGIVHQIEDRLSELLQDRQR